MSESAARPKLLFICLQLTPFVREDLALLTEKYDVCVFQFGSSGFASGLGRSWGLLYYSVKQVSWLVRELPRTEVIYGWFVDYHMVLPTLVARLYKKPIAVVVGGFDATVLPDLHYGVYCHWWRRILARFVVHNVSLLLPVTEELIYSKNRYSTYPLIAEQGVVHHVPDVQTPFVSIPTGYDPSAWPMGSAERSPIVCTVAYVESDRTLRLKGIDLFIEAARQLPHVQFQVVGVSERARRFIQAHYAPPDNVVLQPRQPRAALATIYEKASVYAQLSRSEGLPNVLCEAMCCGCVPVGSAVGGIPHAIGEAGIVVEEPEPSVIATAIEQALSLAPAYRERARQRIVQHFSLSKRRAALLGVLERLQRDRRSTRER